MPLLTLKVDPVNFPALENVKVFAEVTSKTIPSFPTPSDWITIALSPILKLFSAKVTIEYVKLDASINDKLFTLYLGLTLTNQLLSNTLDALIPRDLIWMLSFTEKFAVSSEITFFPRTFPILTSILEVVAIPTTEASLEAIETALIPSNPYALAFRFNSVPTAIS